MLEKTHVFNGTIVISVYSILHTWKLKNVLNYLRGNIIYETKILG